MVWTWPIVSALVLLSAPALCEIPNNKNGFSNFLMGRPYHGLVPPPDVTAEEQQQANNRREFKQKLDHFGTDARTWKQVYYTNDQHAVEGGPVFLILGGESFELGRWIFGSELQYVLAAEANNATLVALEHRFYGNSHPFEDLTTENLKFLSSKQAVEDAHDFIVAMKNANYKNNKWIVFGASYGGSIANYLWKKYPTLVDGVVLSSAFPVALYDYHLYYRALGEALFMDCYRADYTDNCTIALTKAFTQMSQMMYSENGRKTIDTLFNTNPKLSRTGVVQYREMQMFFATIIANLQGITQYKGINLEPYATKAMAPKDACSAMVYGTGNLVENLAALHKKLTTMYTGQTYSGLNIDYDGYVAYLKNAKYSDPQAAATRNWLWQQCTEFGYLTSTDDGDTPFRSVLPTNFYIDLCTDVFGSAYNVMTITKAVADTNNYYGEIGMEENAPITGFEGITYDLWLDVEPTYLEQIHYAQVGHVADIYPSRENSTVNEPELAAVREKIELSIEAMIEGKPVPTSWSAIIPDEDSEGVAKVENAHLIKKRSTYSYKERVDFDEGKSKDARLPSFIMGRPTRGFNSIPQEDDVTADPPNFTAGNFSQKQSHVWLNDQDFFPQRYWENLQYYKKGGPLFLMISGESIASTYWVTNPDVQIMRMAKKYNAAVYMLEHRYYGLSRPTEDMMKYYLLNYLNAEEALGDLAYFIDGINTMRNYTNPKWITFGGSYAGVLSAWFREFYPEKTIGAIASSAPINIKVDFYEYIMVMERSIKSVSADCYNNMKKGFDQMFAKVQTTAGRKELSALYALKPEWTDASVVAEVDVQYFFQNVFGYFMNSVQYNNDNRGTNANPNAGITSFCKILNDATQGEEYKRVAAAFKSLYQIYENTTYTTLDNDYSAFVNLLRNEEYNEYSDTRAWFWQICHQFGYFQSTDIGSNFLGSSQPINFYLNLCTDIFNDSISYDHRIWIHGAETQEKFLGSENYNGTNVVFINGKIDPWSALGNYVEKPTLVIRLLNDTAHCADMYVPRATDSAELAPARQLIDDSIGAWLGVTPSPTSTSTKKPATSTTSTKKPTTKTGTSTTTPRASSATTKDQSRDNGAGGNEVLFTMIMSIMYTLLKQLI